MKSLNISTLDDNDSTRDLYQQVLLAVAYFILTVLALLGNLCVFIINFRWKGDFSRFRITSIFLLNLALTDIGIALANLPFAFISICLDRWVFGPVYCVIDGFVAIYLPVVSITTILLITVHRSIVCLYPLKILITRRLALIACLFSWCWSLIVPIPPLFGISHYEYSPTRGFCRINFVQSEGENSRINNLFVLGITTVFVILPLAVISVLNLILLVTSWKLTLSIPKPNPSAKNDTKIEIIRKKMDSISDQKAFRTVTLVVGAFIMCWLPQVLVTFIGIATKKTAPPAIGTFQALLVMANSAMNPFIYTYVNKDFRSRFVQLVMCRPRRRIATSRRAGSDSNLL